MRSNTRKLLDNLSAYGIQEDDLNPLLSADDIAQRFTYLDKKELKALNKKSFAYWWTNLGILVLVGGLFVVFAVLMTIALKRLGRISSFDIVANMAAVDALNITNAITIVQADTTSKGVYATDQRNALTSQMQNIQTEIGQVLSDAQTINNQIDGLKPLIGDANTRLMNAYDASMAIYSRISAKQATNTSAANFLTSALTQSDYLSKLASLPGLISQTKQNMNTNLNDATQGAETIPHITDGQVYNAISAKAAQLANNIGGLTSAIKLNQQPTPSSTSMGYVTIQLATIQYTVNVETTVVVTLTALYQDGYTSTITAGLDLAYPLQMITLSGPVVSVEFGGLYIVNDAFPSLLIALFSSKSFPRGSDPGGAPLMTVYMSTTPTSGWTVNMKQIADNTYMFSAEATGYAVLSALYPWQKYIDTKIASAANKILSVQCAQVPDPMGLPATLWMSNEAGPAQCMFRYAQISQSPICFLGTYTMDECTCFASAASLPDGTYTVVPMSQCMATACPNAMGTTCPIPTMNLADMPSTGYSPIFVMTFTSA